VNTGYAFHAASRLARETDRRLVKIAADRSLGLRDRDVPSIMRL
jgi:hypothetical protein